LRDSAGLSPDFAVLPAAAAERRDTGNLQAAPVTVKDPSCTAGVTGKLGVADHPDHDTGGD